MVLPGGNRSELWPNMYFWAGIFRFFRSLQIHDLKWVWVFIARYENRMKRHSCFIPVFIPSFHTPVFIVGFKHSPALLNLSSFHTVFIPVFIPRPRLGTQLQLFAEAVFIPRNACVARGLCDKNPNPYLSPEGQKSNVAYFRPRSNQNWF